MEKKKYKQKENHLGYITKSKDQSASLIKVEQDMVLKAGDVLIIKKPSEIVESLVQKNFITREEADERIEKIPSWKMSVIELLPRRS